VIRLDEFNTSYCALNEENKNMVMRGVGSLKSTLPMLCFTEVSRVEIYNNTHLNLVNTAYQ